MRRSRVATWVSSRNPIWCRNSPTPVHTQFGYHVIQVIEHRTSPPPNFDDQKDQLRQQMIQAAIQKEVTQAKTGLKIEAFNMDGSPVKATDTAEPPAAK